MKRSIERMRQSGVALVLTLCVIVLIAVLVVSFSTNTQVEAVAAKGAYSSIEAKLLADYAINEAFEKIKKATPNDRHWGAGPGRIQTWSGSNWIKTELHSGNAGGPYGDVALNVPILGSETKFTIMSANSEHPNPDPMMISWINVLKDGTVSTDPNYANAISSANPVVGRYAYWVDTENSKVNINTAGRAQTSYRLQQVYNSDGWRRTVGDPQNLTGHPSRVDLAKLAKVVDSTTRLPKVSGGSVSREASLATFKYTDTSYWDDSPYDSAVEKKDLKQNTTGNKRFSTVEEWVSIGNGINSEIVEANKFNLTIGARAPEVNPWGVNKIWMQYFGAHGSTPSAGEINRLNEYESPFYSSTLVMGSESPTDVVDGNKTWYGGKIPESRYYVFPNFRRTNAEKTKNMQFLGDSLLFHTGGINASTGFADYMKGMMDLLERNDWPGFTGLSFVGKYGVHEARLIATNIMNLYDSAVAGGGIAPHQHGSNSAYGHPVFMYGGQYLEGIRAVPFVNEISVKFEPSFDGLLVRSNEVGLPHGATITPPELDPDKLGGKDDEGVGAEDDDDREGGGGSEVLEGDLSAFTKTNKRPGFARPINSDNYGLGAKNYMNVKVTPTIELWIPDRFGFLDLSVRQASGNVAAVQISDIEVICEGRKDNKPVKYSSIADADAGEEGKKNRFIWSRDDDSSGMGVGNGPPAPVPPMTSPMKHLSKGSYSYISPVSFYVGPFDKNKAPKITVGFRVNTMAFNRWTLFSTLQRIPSGYITGNIAGGVSDINNPPRLYFSTDKLVLDAAKTNRVYVAAQANDPREFRYPENWTMQEDTFKNDTLGGPNDGYTSTSVDESGYVWDDSKLNWPDVGARGGSVYGNSSHSHRGDQFANNITGLPGVGWLSMIPTNATSKILTGSAAPWRTLKFGQETQQGVLPDWLLIDLFGIAYSSTYLSHTDGKVNINAKLEPFGINRLTPLKALLVPSDQDEKGEEDTSANVDVDKIAEDIANRVGIQSGPCGNLPSDTFVYSGQIAQVPSLTQYGKNNFVKESLFRDIAGIVTTQCADYKVYGVSQSLDKQGNPVSEKRFSAIISREVNVGVDGVPGTADDFAGKDGIARNADDLEYYSESGARIPELKYDGTDPVPVERAGRPAFRYRLRDVNFMVY